MIFAEIFMAFRAPLADACKKLPGFPSGLMYRGITIRMDIIDDYMVYAELSIWL